MTSTTMMQRQEFVGLAKQAGINFRELCRRFGISAKTGYKWRKRAAEGGVEALRDRSRRPKSRPRRSVAEVEAKVVGLRVLHPIWGGRKLRRRLLDLGEKGVPAACTCTAILHPHGLPLSEPGKHTAFERFERDQPNELWQMDFKGRFPTLDGGRCHPLTVLDDHSRYNLALQACGDERGETARDALTRVFGRYGLPAMILCDNGAPWGDAPYHPQTQGKDERFHRTLKAELIASRTWRHLTECAEHFPRFRQIYNQERPHDALNGATPASRYRPSPRTLPAHLPSLEHPRSDMLRVVRGTGVLTFGGQTWLIGRAFAGLPVTPPPKGTKRSSA